MHSLKRIKIALADLIYYQKKCCNLISSILIVLNELLSILIHRKQYHRVDSTQSKLTMNFD